MAQVIIKYDLYSMYDRLLEGVLVDITVEYDISEMLKYNKLSSSSLTVKKIELTGDNAMYVSSQPFDIHEIYKDVKKRFEDFGTLQEEWGETITNQEYEQIKHLV